MQNFTEGQHVSTIKNIGTIYSATGDGRVGFVSADDIAEVGVRALIDDKPHNTAHVITGPHSLTYGEVAQLISHVIGKTIQHISLSDEELKVGMIVSRCYLPVIEIIGPPLSIMNQIEFISIIILMHPRIIQQRPISIIDFCTLNFT
ncbi:hypothetical protein ABIA61_000704 [Paenibacillus sp. RC21]